MSQTVKVYCLASFNEEEADEILSQLEDDSHNSYSSFNVRVQLIPWTSDRDGGKDDIFKLFFESQETVEDFMFFFDRTSLTRQDFLIADVRDAKKKGPLSISSSVRCSVIEANANRAARSDFSPSNTTISLGRCGGENGWYGNPYSGIKKTYLSLVSGHIRFDETVCKSRVRQSRLVDTSFMSSALDICDEAYSAQVRLAQRQADLLCLELQVKPHQNDQETYKTSEQIRNGRGFAYHSSSRWVGSPANDLRSSLPRLRG